LEREGQARFRQIVLQAYEYRCAITECDVTEALEAAHLDPYCDFGPDSQVVTNGFPLRAGLHYLFDQGLLSIRPRSKKVWLAKRLKGSCYEEFRDRRIHLPDDKSSWPDQAALQRRWENREKG
jgi:predicted restriction endonuclease